MTRTIEVLGTPHGVNVQRKYKTIWVAVGEYGGQRIEVKARSESDAVAAWREACAAVAPVGG